MFLVTATVSLFLPTPKPVQTISKYHQIWTKGTSFHTQYIVTYSHLDAGKKLKQELTRRNCFFEVPATFGPPYSLPGRLISNPNKFLNILMNL
jgi:hypothetical protein